MVTTANSTIYQDLIDIFHYGNIRYIISVDDCFATNYTDEIRQELIIDASMTHNNVITFLEKMGKDVSNVKQLIELSTDAQNEITELINSLSDVEVQKYTSFNPQGKSASDLSSDKEVILHFLDELKSEGIIEEYKTFSSTRDAQLFDAESENLTNGSILWLIDRNFEKTNESADAGIEFAKNKILSNSSNNYFFILTTFKANSDDEKAVEVEFDEIFSDLDEKNSSLVYYVSKDKLLNKKYKGVAKSLANGINRRLYFQIIGEYISCLKLGSIQTVRKLHEIRKKVLDYVFVNKIEAKGESYFDFFGRLIKIYLDENYSSALSKKYTEISKKLKDFKQMLDFSSPNVSQNDVEEELIEIKELELYDIHINSRHSEIASGDIFKIRGDYYILSTQPCDTVLRREGERKLKSSAILLKIGSKVGRSTEFKHDLFCFNDVDFSIDKAAIFFQDYFLIPFEILDLCVTDKNGRACIKISDLNDDCKLDAKFTPNYINRYKHIKTMLAEVYRNMEYVKSFFVSPQSSNFDEANKSYKYILNVDNEIKRYTIEDDILIYDVQRVSRLNELHTISMLNGYSGTLSRVGMPFDLLGKDNKND